MKPTELTELTYPIDVLSVFQRDDADLCYTAEELSKLSAKVYSTTICNLNQLVREGIVCKQKSKNRKTKRRCLLYYLKENEEEVLNLLGGVK